MSMDFFYKLHTAWDIKHFLLRFKGTTMYVCFGTDSQNEWKDHVVYVYVPFDKNWAEEPLSWVKGNIFIYLQSDYEM